MLISHCCGGVKKLKNISPPFWNCVVGIHVFQTFSDDIKLNVFFFFLYRFYEKSETARVAQTSRIVQPNRPLSGPSWCLLKSSFKLTPFPPAALSFFFKKWIRSDGLHSSLDARFCLLFLFFSCVWMISTLVWTGRCAIKMSSIDQCNSVCVCVPVCGTFLPPKVLYYIVEIPIILSYSIYI